MRDVGEAYRRDGCVLVKGFFTKPEIAWLTETVEPLHQAWLREAGSSVVGEKLINSHSLTKAIYFAPDALSRRLELFQFLSSPKILESLRELLGEDLFFLNTQLFFNPEGYRKDGYWHRDTQYLGKPEDEQRELFKRDLLLHLHIPLLDDPIFEYVPGSHLRWDSPEEREIRLELNGHRNSELMPGARAYPANAGDALFFSVHGIHRGRAYEELPRRRTFDVIYGKRHEGLRAFDPECLPAPAELAMLEGASLFK